MRKENRLKNKMSDYTELIESYYNLPEQDYYDKVLDFQIDNYKAFFESDLEEDFE